MNKDGQIYPLDEQSTADKGDEKIREDVARLDGYLRGRSEQQDLDAHVAKLIEEKRKRARR